MNVKRQKKGFSLILCMKPHPLGNPRKFNNFLLIVFGEGCPRATGRFGSWPCQNSLSFLSFGRNKAVLLRTCTAKIETFGVFFLFVFVDTHRLVIPNVWETFDAIFWNGQTFHTIFRNEARRNRQLVSFKTPGTKKRPSPQKLSEECVGSVLHFSFIAFQK